MMKSLANGLWFGPAVVAVWGARARCGWADIFPIVDSRVNSEVCPMFFQLGTGDTPAMAFGEAGFSEVQTERVHTILHYDSAEDAIGAAFAGGPVALAYSRFDDAEYLASIEAHRKESGYDIPGEFVVTAGRRAG